MITTQRELRALFWSENPHLSRRYMTETTVDRYSGATSSRVRPATQNEYHADVRMAWCDFVEHIQRSGQIGEDLADRATL